MVKNNNTLKTQLRIGPHLVRMSRPYRDHTADHIGDSQMSDHIKRGKQVEPGALGE
jgi:hypothetical protein